MTLVSDVAYPRRYQDALDMAGRHDGPVVIIPTTSPRTGLRFLHVDCFHCDHEHEGDLGQSMLASIAAILICAAELESVGYPVGRHGTGADE